MPESSTPSVIISPERFQLVPNVSEDCTLEVTNVGFEPVMYRFLTTNPNRYVVKHSKGVIRGNSSSKVVVVLNKRHLMTDVPPGTTVLKDDFRMDCAVVSPKDVIEPRGANVLQLLKERKETDKAAVLKKMVRVHVVLNAHTAAVGNKLGDGVSRDATAATGSINEPNSFSGSAGSGQRMSVRDLEKNTLDERNRRRECGQESLSKGKVAGLVAAVVFAALAMWWIAM